MLAACLLLLSASFQDAESTREVLASGIVVEREVSRDEAGELVSDGKYLEWWPDGGRKVEGRYREGLRHGKWREWHASGEKAARGTYKHGLRDREWTAWRPDGTEVASESGEFAVVELKDRARNLRARGETRDGIRHGQWTSFWPGGIEQVRCTYREGQLEGPLVFFHPEGTPDPAWISGHYAGGTRTGALDDELLPEPQPSPAPRGEIATLLEKLRSEPGESEVTERLFELALDDEILPDVLIQLDLGRHDEAQLATMILRERVLPVWKSSFTWTEGPAADGKPLKLEQFETSPLSTLRWASLLRITEADFRLLELPLQLMGRDPEDGLLPLETLHPLPAELRPERDLASSSYAARFEQRRGPRTGVVALGLDWLARHQSADGSWDGDGFTASCRGENPCEGVGEEYNDVGVTALALLAFLGDGHTPVDGAHKEVVARGLTWLVSQQNRKGHIMGPKLAHSALYNHAVASLVLAEAAFFTDSERVRSALKRAIKVIEGARNPYSAWRYDIPPKGDNDTSMTGWMVMALNRAREAGVGVDEEAFSGALSFIDEVTDPASGRCGYDTLGGMSARIEFVNDHYPAEKGEAMTAVALMCRAFLGQSPKEVPVMEKHARLMLQTLPEWDPDGFGCDFYYWFYGSQAMHQMGGARYWEAWNKALAHAVEDSQRVDDDAAGSWDPVGPWGFAGGRVYSTSMALLALEADYRYVRLDTMEPDD